MSAVGYPLKMAAALHAKTWGGDRLRLYGKRLEAEQVGESLESSSDSIVTNGPLAGRTLGELAWAYPAALLGARGASVSGAARDFPLLVKLIDARESLSVQVHPDDDMAPPEARGKTEAWLVLQAEPGSRLIVGVDGPLDLPRIEHQLVFEPVAPGDVFFLPAGTIHAIGAGVLLYEVQQASNVTYRLYDWGRDRELHVRDAERVSRVPQRATRVTPLRLDDEREMLAACRHFAIERWTLTGRRVLRAYQESFRVLTILQGSLSIAGTLAGTGDTVVLPADLSECVMEGNAEVVVAYIPDIERDVVAPLESAGRRRQDIDALGIVW